MRYGALIAIITLACLSAILGLGYADSHQEMIRLQAENSGLQKKLAPLSAEINELRDRNNALDEELRKKTKLLADAEAAAKAATQLATLRRSTGGNGGNQEQAFTNPSPEERSPDDQSPEAIAREERRKQAMRRHQIQMISGGLGGRMADRTYGRMFTSTGMTEEEQKQFKAVLDLRGQRMGEIANALLDAKTPEERAALQAKAREVAMEIERKMIETLGSEKYAEYQLQNKIQHLDFTIQRLSRSTHNGEPTITDAQKDNLYAAAKQVANGFQFTTDLSTPEKVLSNGVTDESAKIYLEERKQMNQQILTAIEGSVTEEQLAQFKISQEHMERFAEWGLNGAKALLNGESLENTPFGGGPSRGPRGNR